MRINKINAMAFGPLADESLSLAPGMTVVVGDNESAKSSWHAAVYAALCGRRRGRGAPTREERRFVELHRPWEGDKWAVSADLTLDDGRNVEIYQDLDGKVDCRARDLDLGARDVSNEIMFDGSPDASQWLGLDRRSFSATACVNQAELLKVLDQADGLQQHLQRAAATAGTDATAAAAITRLDEFSRDRVGLDRANSSKPLRRAKDGVESARAALAEAQRAHGEYLALVTAADSARQAAGQATAEAAAVQELATALEKLLAAAQQCVSAQAQVQRLRERAETLAAELDEAVRRLQRAIELDGRFQSIAPAGTVADDDAIQRVTAALTAHRSASPPVPLTGRTSAALQAAIEALPSAPTGDIAVDAAVRAALLRFREAKAVAHQHASDRPADPGHATAEVGAVVAAGPQKARELAVALDARGPVADSRPAEAAEAAEAAARERQGAEDEHAAALRRERAAGEALSGAQGQLSVLSAARATEEQRAREDSAAQQRTADAGRRRAGAVLAAGAILALAAVVAFVAGAATPGAAAAAVALTVLVLGAVLRFRVARAAGTDVAFRTVEGQLAEAQHLAQATADAHQVAVVALEEARQRLNTAESGLAAAQGRLDAYDDARNRTAAALNDLRRECAHLGLPADPEVLQDIAAAAERWVAADLAYRTWEARAAELQHALDSVAAVLMAALDTRGVAPEAEPELRATRYEQHCVDRAAQQVQAGQRDALDRELAARLAAEQVLADQESTRLQADDALRAAAAERGLPDAATASPDALAQALTAWQDERSIALRQVDQEQQHWAELQALLQGRTLQQLENFVEELRARHVLAAQAVEAAEATLTTALRARDDRLTALGPDVLPGAAPVDLVSQVSEALDETRDRLTQARQASSHADRRAADTEGELRERARRVTSVAGAEETLLDAETTLARVTELEETLRVTRSFLATAQQRVHRDIAPVLATTLTQWLPEITAGRYVDARVDPESLEVRVAGPGRNWRLADHLSHGTAEQVYLLLRVALAHHLVQAGTTSPLLLDDVTVQADSKRTLQILEWLHELSRDQQVVLFAQQSLVADWARQNLTDPQDAVVELSPVAVD